MRRLCTLGELRRNGVTRAARDKGWVRVQWGVYAEGNSPPTPLEGALALAVATRGVATGRLAGALLGLDAISPSADVTVAPGSSNCRAKVRRRVLDPEDIVAVHGYRCTSALLTLLDLAAEVDDLVWEQALESALRKRLVTVAAIEARAHDIPGAERIRRVLALRPAGAKPTGSLLETLMVQLARDVKGLGPPQRQVEVRNRHGDFVAYVDLAWPELGIFIELDGQQHKDQPVYDARRETAVVAATGWLVGRYTWTEVVHLPSTTARRLAEVVWQARRRPVAS
ncbi:MAG TPA: DUF559 domain-containing protein [Acidimicrobiales bacterium]|nr:DUF559 domain-containing protein [Acidimicrobiales bacterium]